MNTEEMQEEIDNLQSEVYRLEGALEILEENHEVEVAEYAGTVVRLRWAIEELLPFVVTGSVESARAVYEAKELLR